MNNEPLAHAQADMRSAYCSGGAGVLASSLAWAAATVATLKLAPMQAVWVLFVGGMLIHPVSIVICKLLGATGKHAKGNPLGMLAGATVFWLIFSLPLAYVVALYKIEWFFPAMLLVIGGRYLTFATLFGMRVYWVLGLTLAVAGYWLGKLLATPTISAFAGSAIEMAFSAYILAMHRRAP
jgi:hypothetical protein